MLNGGVIQGYRHDFERRGLGKMKCVCTYAQNGTTMIQAAKTVSHPPPPVCLNQFKVNKTGSNQPRNLLIVFLFHLLLTASCNL